MRLSRKLYLGFGLLIVLAIIQGGTAIWSMSSARASATGLAQEYTPQIVLAGRIQHETAMAGYFMRAYFASLDEKDYERGMERLAMLHQDFGDLKQLAARATLAKGLDEYIAALEGDVEEYEALCLRIHELSKGIVLARQNIRASATAFAIAVGKLRESFDADLVKEKGAYEAAGDPVPLKVANQLLWRHIRFGVLGGLEGRGVAAERDIWSAVAGNEQGGLDGVITQLDALQKAAGEQHTATRQEKNRVFTGAIVESVKTVRDMTAAIKEASAQLAAAGVERVAAFDRMLEHSANLMVAGERAIEAETAATSVLIDQAAVVQSVGMAAILLLGALASFAIVRGVTARIRDVSRELAEVGESLGRSLGDGAMTMASTSEALAKATARQSANLTETSDAVRNMSSMTGANAKNAQDTNRETAAVVRQIAEGSSAVKDMDSAMDEINDSAGKIGAIIKTIEEIAFQTNLLALNAAVEAARAGEAGKGFAVVADEVRTLAQRSAQAAGDTSGLIHGTVDRVKRGTEISSHLRDLFSGIEGSAQNVGRLVAEITRATDEQAQGVEQISGTIGEIDKDTKESAKFADEISDASSGMGDQGEKLLHATRELDALVHGRRE